MFFSRTNGPILIKVGTNHDRVNGILNCTTTESVPLQRGDDQKMQKFGQVIEK
jgi:hypothetical protein